MKDESKRAGAKLITAESKKAGYVKPSAKPRKAKDRACLICTGVFRSMGPENRICTKCKSGDAWNGPVDLSITRPR